MKRVENNAGIFVFIFESVGWQNPPFQVHKTEILIFGITKYLQAILDRLIKSFHTNAKSGGPHCPHSPKCWTHKV